MILAPGVLLNKRYMIQEVIARGGMGAIYRAMDESLGVEVAVKENLFSTEEFSRQFRREATLLASLRHNHLPRVTDHFVLEDQGQYLVMDYIPGDDLRKTMTRIGKLPENDGLRIGIDICEAVAYLHRRDPAILHRDIKPGNIKITPSGQVFLVDFGLAKIGQTGQQTTIGAQSLTPGFAPPEQYGQGTDARSDIYALAATLYAALTASTPEDGLSRAMGSAELTPIRMRNPQISEETAAVIEHGLAIDPDKRFQSAESFGAELQKALEHNLNPNAIPPSMPAAVPGPGSRPVSGLPPAAAALPQNQTVQRRQAAQPGAGERIPSQPAQVTHPRPKTPWVAYGLITIVLLGGLAGAGFLFSKGLFPRPTPTSLPVPTTAQVVFQPSATPPPPPATLPPAPQPTAALALESTATLPAAAPTATNLPPAQANTPASTPIGGSTGQLAFASNRGGKFQVWLMNVDGGDAHAVTQMQDGACQPDWSPDGKHIVFISPCKGKQEQYAGSSLFIINPDGSGLISLASTPGGDFDPAWSPEGSRIVFTSLRGGKPQLYLYQLADNKVTRLSPTSVYDRQAGWSPDSQQIVFTTSRQGHSQIWTMNADGSGAHEFSIFDRGAASQPAWSRDGQIILFTEGSPPPGLIAKRIDDRINEFSIAANVRPVLGVKFSADGGWIVFEGTLDGKPGLMRMTPNGTNLARITDGANQDIQPVWIP